MREQLKEQAPKVWLHLSKYRFVYLIVFLLFCGAVYIFFPRNMKTLLLKDLDSTEVEISIAKTTEDGVWEITLTEEEKSKMLMLWEQSSVRINPFPKKYVSEDFMGYHIYISTNQDWVYYFSTDIISINERQYLIYGDTFTEEFLSIIEREG